VNSPASEQPRFHVIVTGPENDGRRYDIGSDGLLVGRSDTCDVVFHNREVSRRHAYFYPDGESCWVEDLSSRNGILVNAQRVERKRLRDGDVVGIGRSRFMVASSNGARRLSRWLSAGRASSDAVDDEPFASRTPAAPLAVAGLAFGVAAYLHWVLGLCAIVLALLAFREMHRQPAHLRYSLLLCGVLIGVTGAASNLWFQRVTPGWRSRRATAQQRACRENLEKVSGAIAAYRSDHGGSYPPNLDTLVDRGYMAAKALRCPGCEATAKGRGRYVYLPPTGRVARNPYAVLVCDPRPFCHGERGGWVLRRDGRLDLTPPEQLRELLDAAGTPSSEPGGG